MKLRTQRKNNMHLMEYFFLGLLFPSSFVWGHGDLSAVLYFILFLGALPAIPLTFLTMQFLLRKSVVPKKGEIPVSIAQLLGVSVIITSIFWVLPANEVILKAFRPLLVCLWVIGNIAIFARFAWLESQDVYKTIFVAIFAIIEVFVLSVLFGSILSRLI